MVATSSRPRASTRARVRRAGLIALAVFLAYAVAAVGCFVLPASDPLPRHADVAMVLGPPTPERRATAMHLLDTGVVDAVQISLAQDYRQRGTSASLAAALCRRDRERVHCALPVPYTTQGEARMLRDGAEAHGWRSAIVITQNAHLRRARTIVSRCFSGAIAMRTSGERPTHGWGYQVAYQTLASLKAWFVTPGC